MKHCLMIFIALLGSLTTQMSFGQVVEDECPCGDALWTDQLLEETDPQQVVLQMVSMLTCELPYSREVSENPLSLLMPFMDTSERMPYEAFFYGLEQIVSHGRETGYLDQNCDQALQATKKHLEKLTNKK